MKEVHLGIMKMKFIFFAICLTFKMNAAISISSIQKKDSRCLNNGSITIIATSNQQIFYSIMTGPVTVAPQVSNTFNSLGAGTYKIVVLNLANERDSILVTINSTYTPPEFDQIITIPTCRTSNNGRVIGNTLPNKGLPPFTWTLRNKITGQVATQVGNDVFNNLGNGEYSLTMTDTCLNTTVHNFEIKSTFPILPGGSGHIFRPNCHDVIANVSMPNNQEFYPMTVKFLYKGLVDSIVVNSMPLGAYLEKKLNFDPKTDEVQVIAISKCKDSVSFSIRGYYGGFISYCYTFHPCNTIRLSLNSYNYPIIVTVKAKFNQQSLSIGSNSNAIINLTGLKIGDTVHYTSIACSETQTNYFIVSQPFLLLNESSYFNGCRNVYKYTMNIPNCNSYGGYQSISYSLIDNSTGAVLETKSGVSSIDLLDYTGNKTYKLIVKDPCDSIINQTTFFWKDTSNIAVKKLNFTITKDYTRVCLDSTVNVKIETSNNDLVNGFGIKSIFADQNSINTKQKYSFNDSSIYRIYNNYDGLYIASLTPGRYYISFGDQCRTINTFFDIYPVDVANNYESLKLIKACGDNNRVALNLNSVHFTMHSSFTKKEVEGSYSFYDVKRDKFIEFNKSFFYNASKNFNYFDTFKYLKEGMYILTVNYSNSNSFSGKLGCQTIHDTIIVPPYTRPAIKVVVKVRCNEKTYVVFVPDSAHGVFPYKFEINNGPVTYPVQYANHFEVNQLGNYQARIWDTCGNVNTLNFSVDTLLFEPIYESDKSCESKNVLIKYQTSPFFSYRWKTPIGSILLGDSLKIDSVALKDIGLYEITRYVSFFGCKDTFKNDYLVNKHKYLNRHDTIYKGDSSYYNRVYHKTDIFLTDTVYINPCDSISTYSLVVIDTTIIDTVNLRIARCLGDTFHFLDTYFTKTGKHVFTLRTNWGKKTKILLSLEFDYYIWSRTQATICQGESYRGYTQAGIYRDTLRSSQICDSIAELDLWVNPVYNRALDTIVCAGQEVIFGGKIYNTSGQYTDRYKTINGCDSIEVLQLKVWDRPYSRNDTFNACRHHRYKSKLYFKNTDILDTVFNFLGCDSIYLFVHLNIGSTPLQFFDSINFCDTMRVAGILYSNNFYYKDTLRYSTGLKCDSMYRLFKYNHRKSSQLKLTIYPNTTTLYQGEKVKLSLTPANHYRWSNGDTLQQLEFNAQKDTSFSVVAWNTPLCKDTISLNLTVLEPGILDIPKAFAPGGMIENRLFKPNFHGMADINRFEIYNRWGEKIYSTNTKENIGWDGTYKGEDVPSGLFTFLLEYKVNRSIFFKTGEVLLVR